MFKLLQTHTIKILSEDKLKQRCLRNKCYLFLTYITYITVLYVFYFIFMCILNDFYM